MNSSNSAFISRQINTGRPSILLIFLVLSLTGCKQYQYLTLNSQMERTNNPYEFVEENDIYKITYYFNDAALPLKIKVFNKGNDPLYIDWQKSHVILNQKSIPYWDNTGRLSGKVDSYEFLGGYATGDIEGSVTFAEQVSYIPQESYKTFHPLNLQTNHFKKEQLGKPVKTTIKTKDGWAQANAYSFDEENTPLRFKSHLVLAQTEDFSNPMYVEDTFWIKELWETYSHPSNLLYQKMNQSYIVEPTTFGVVTGTIALGAACVVLMALDTEEE